MNPIKGMGKYVTVMVPSRNVTRPCPALENILVSGTLYNSKRMIVALGMKLAEAPFLSHSMENLRPDR